MATKRPRHASSVSSDPPPKYIAGTYEDEGVEPLEAQLAASPLSTEALQEKRALEAALVNETQRKRRRSCVEQPWKDAEPVFTVILTDVGSQKGKVRLEVRDITGMRIKEARELLSCAPVAIKENVSEVDAEIVRDKLLRVGASVTINCCQQDNAWFFVHVVELEDEAEFELKSRFDNPRRDHEFSCVYVGCSYLRPEEWLEQHRIGERSIECVKLYGKSLLPELYQHLNPLTSYEAARKEVQVLTEELLRMGYEVYS